MRTLSPNNTYKRTPKGKLTNCYDNMVARTRGYSNRPWLYQDLEVNFTRREFIDNYINDEDYIRLHKEWEESGYEIRMAPSTDRIDNRRGYSFDNIEFVPFWVNCSRGAQSRNGNWS